MCGIAGIFNSDRKTDEDTLKKMTDAISHRGPDGEGHWTNDKGNLSFGHRRLSIIDLSDHGKQPMHYMGRYTISFNGEIYNFIELKKSLSEAGYSFRSKSDTEVLLALYDQKKEKCLSHLDGMFAFVIWDEIEKTLFCARDRFGEKPFYYHYQPGTQFIFASEMKALFAAGVTKTINNKTLLNYLTDGWVGNPYCKEDTFYSEIQKLEAGCYLTLKENIILKKEKYWKLDLEKKINITFEDAIQQFKELFTESVKRRLRSDVTVGSSLSGGIDSSTIVCLINSFNPFSQQTFSASFPGYEKDETSYMKMVIDKTGVNAHFTSPDASTLAEQLELLFYHQEEPFTSASILAQWEVMRLAKTNNTIVLIDGQGADEILAGYKYYYRPYFQEIYKYNKQIFHDEYNAYLAWGGTDFKFDWKARMQADFPRVYNFYQKIKTGPTNHQDIHPDFYEPNKSLVYKLLTFNTSLNHYLHNTLSFTGLFEDLLRYADRNSMAFSRETRMPFLYHSLVEFCYSLPSTYKIHHGWTKYLLRKSFEELVPSEITWRKDKIGYAPPQDRWMKTRAMKEIISAAINKLCDEKIIDRKNINQSKYWMYLMAYYLIKNE